MYIDISYDKTLFAQKFACPHHNFCQIARLIASYLRLINIKNTNWIFVYAWLKFSKRNIWHSINIGLYILFFLQGQLWILLLQIGNHSWLFF